MDEDPRAELERLCQYNPTLNWEVPLRGSNLRAQYNDRHLRNAENCCPPELDYST